MYPQACVKYTLPFITDPAILFWLWTTAAELLFGGILAQAGGSPPFSDEEQERLNWLIFVLFLVATVLTEWAGWAAPPVGAVLVLASLLILWATALWLWPGVWVYGRRIFCSIVVPWAVTNFTWVIDHYLECAAWVWSASNGTREQRVSVFNSPRGPRRLVNRGLLIRYYVFYGALYVVAGM